MELKNTVEMMNSADYKERFRAEYYQTKCRYEKLKAYNTRIDAAGYDSTIEMPPHSCPAHLLIEQQTIMGRYLYMLELRAVFEGIEL